jgi:hypothetical protein
LYWYEIAYTAIHIQDDNFYQDINYGVALVLLGKRAEAEQCYGAPYRFSYRSTRRTFSFVKV